MKIKKYIAFVLCAALLPCCAAGCMQENQNSETEVSEMSTESTSAETTAAETTAEEVKEFPTAQVNAAYQNITIDGNTVNMDEGTVFRGLGAVTGNNSSRLLMDYKTQNPEAY